MQPELSQLCAVPFLSSLDADTLARLQERANPVQVPAGEVILREGEFSDCLYVVVEGSVQVFATAFNLADMVLARLDTGQWFGDQGFLSGGTARADASVRVLSDCKLLVLSSRATSGVLDADHGLAERLNAESEARRSLRAFRVQDEVFSSLGLSTGDASYRIEKFAAGEYVFREGDPAERVYLVLRGRAQVRGKKDGQQVTEWEIHPGQFFGEVAILERTPRSRTVMALEDLEAASIDGEWFREAHRDNDKLRSSMESLRSMYLMPRRGLMTLQTGQVDGNPSHVVVHNLQDGRRVVSIRLVGRSAFTSRVVVDLADASVVTFDAPAQGAYRELNVKDCRVVRIYSEGEWTGLGRMLDFLLDGTVAEDWQLELFRDRGDFHVEEMRPLYEGTEVICACTKTTCGQITAAIQSGCHTLEAVAARTGATQVCGGCTPLVKELLGQSDWTAARIVGSQPMGPDVRSFRLLPASGCRPFKPGQHVVVQARIDNRWIQRAYTISSAPTTTDHYEITVKREPQGVFSRWLFDRLERDSFLRVSEPAGSWYLPDGHSRDVVFMAGGIGVTPALSMARSAGLASGAFRLHLDYSCQRHDHVICRAELEALAAKHSNLRLRIRVTGEQGRLTPDEVRTLVQEYHGADFFLCGSGAFVAGVTGALAAAGVPAERIRTEVFTVAGEKPKRRPEDGTPSRPGQLALVTEQPQTPIDQARDVLRRFYTVTGAIGAFEARWKQVEASFRETGTYAKTTEELAYAARLAWRNSTRCVGRLYWDGLALRDYRHVTTGAAMLEAIMGHIEMATNRGSIRPVITVFPPRDPKGQGPKVWSPQLFRYACYRRSDGTVLGDPANRELTDVAIALGWNPPEHRTAFDLLPVIVQGQGEAPQWAEIPRSLVLEAPIEHPELPWFAELGLRWYALPAVSSMMLDAGGVQYCAAPFNGWYMGTEIGARNFGDVDRYDMLPVVARKLGLDTTTNRTLWRDRALVELNIAVLHSYDKAGITMMDHHAASESFDRFEQLENELGRTVHARWNWIVPPISGSAVSVFHRDHWKDIELKPNYYPQPDAWKQDQSWRRGAAGKK